MDLIIINEAWRSVDGFINYQVSNIGNVRNANTGRILKPKTDRYGYMTVGIYDGNNRKLCKIHRLVGKAFVANPDSGSY